MIPSVLASRFREGLNDYVETSYPITSPIFENSLHRFLEKENAFFHEPYISVKLPFRVAEHGNERFESIHSDYSPYVHQNKAYDRLLGDEPQSTLVATGTGSGKTECFLYPILEYCYQHRKEKGIKALIIYPMNALASDQAGRIAKEIYKSPELRGNVKAGMFVGGFSAQDTKGMTKDMVITDHETLLANPPDILMTNYKMLDYLLVQPKNAGLWSLNDNPKTLRFLVVDELHTFDGAQGTDLACLIRRLKSRLMVPTSDYLCCVGTSATMGGPESISAMQDYAGKVFGEHFDDEAIITEDRLTSHEFFEGQEVSFFRIPESADVEKLRTFAESEQEDEYLKLTARCWFEEERQIADPLSDEGRVEIGDKLMHHSFFQSLMGTIKGRIMQPEAICDELSTVYPEMRSELGKDLLESMLALISHARTRDIMNHLRPFLQVQVQLWMRELRRVRAKVDPVDAELILESDLNQDKEDRNIHYLPVVNCHDCGATGWVGMLDEVSQLSVKDTKIFYNKYFEFDKKISMAFPRREDEQGNLNLTKARLCPECKYAKIDESDKCSNCGHETIPIWLVKPDVDKHAKNYICPFCGGNHSLIFIGLQTATAISAGLSQIYGSKFNDDKKLLAFNDNVQDASHRAGFFNARTWRFVLRTAMQHYVRNGGEGLNVLEFGHQMNQYWLDQMGEETWVDTFIPHDMSGDRCYEELQKTGHFPNDPAKKSLMYNLTQRIAYETILEYGVSSQIGRTLEKNGSSMVGPRIDLLREVASRALPRIENEAGIRELDQEKLIGYLLGLIRHLRIQGAFALDDYKTYIENGANAFVLTKTRPWMSKAVYKAPKFPSTFAAGAFEVLNEQCWYIRKMSHLLGKTLLESPGIRNAVEIILQELEGQQILKRMYGPKGAPVFGLNPDFFTVTTHIATLRCDECGQIIRVPKDQQKNWENAVCVRDGCLGHYHAASDPSSCFASLYERGDVIRIHAREHTGLLERGERELLETEFKHKAAEHKSWDPNLLSCTPTLEMGIDIGDLSTVLLCSVPPAQANYVQRVGRAGRTDGNAMTVAIAASKAHDLYFFQEPMDMIAGEVDPPGVFLNASAVLERQFVAFCFDNWVSSGIPETAVSSDLQSILNKFSPRARSQVGFPFNFLDYTKSHLSQLIRKFSRMFDTENGNELSDDTRERIRIFAMGEGLAHEGMRSRLLTTFKVLYDQRESLNGDIKKLKDAIKKLENGIKDASITAQIDELQQEREGLSAVVNRINSTTTFEFMSEEGLLPNYAFPEAGVNLKAILTRKVPLEGKDGSRKYGYEKYSKEYNRAAASAITEFAPDNTFYANGHKLVIDQVDVSRDEEAERWRFCPDCNYMALDSTLNNVASCPRCGSLAWADQGQVRIMHKVRTVYANSPYEATITGDESDNRSVKYYSNQMLVDIDEEKDVECGYQTTTGDIPFGFEYVKKATMREINFGQSDNFGTRLTIAGKEEIRNGFVICKYCGKLQPKGQKAAPRHTSICRAVSQNLKEPFEECVFLYREFASEAVRILIPSTTMESSKKMESFAAAIMLGLRKKFSNVDHLRFCVMDAPVQGEAYRKQYMVIYDSVPGGTGYLKELTASPEGIFEIFEKALDAMEHCACASDESKDGCYHCLFGYRQSNKINNISRKAATELLRKIVAEKASVEKIKTIGDIVVNTLFDSELEKRFIEAIAQSSTKDRVVSITKSPVNGKEGYFLEIGDCYWDVELQVDFDGSQGVAVPSRADFVFWPRSSKTTQKPVVVFTDGYKYHREIADVDSNKRLAIRDACGYPVWSLTWKDIQDRLSSTSVVFGSDALNANQMPGADDYRRTLQKTKQTDWNIRVLSSFDLLLKYLSDKDAEDHFRDYAAALSVGMLDQTGSRNNDEYVTWQKGYDLFEQMHTAEKKPQFGKYVFGTWKPHEAVGFYATLPLSAAKAMKTPDGKLVLVFDESKTSLIGVFDDTEIEDTSAHQEAWSTFLYCSNMIQFSPKQCLITRKGMQDKLYDWYINRHCHDDESVGLQDPRWSGIIDEELFDPECIQLARMLQSLHKKAPSGTGYEDSEGNVVAEMVWEEEKIAVQLGCQESFAGQLKETGWQVYSVSDQSVTDAIKEV